MSLNLSRQNCIKDCVSSISSLPYYCNNRENNVVNLKALLKTNNISPEVDFIITCQSVINKIEYKGLFRWYVQKKYFHGELQS